MKNNLSLYVTVLIASLSGFLSGFDTGVISGALLYIQKTFEITPEISGFLVSSVSVGAILGALFNGFLIDKLGRRKILLLSALIFFFGSIFCAYSVTVFQLILSRLILGMAVGIVSFAGPLYLSEISIKDKRGSIVSMYQASLTFGILFSYLSNYICAKYALSWKIMLAIGAIPALILFFGMIFQKDTARWYMLSNQKDKAIEVLSRMYFKNQVEIEIANISNTLTNEKIKFNKKLLKPLLIGIGIMFAQIATGINAIIYYAPTVFKSLGFNSDENVLLLTILIGLINFLMTFVAFVFVDKIGRKPLLYIGLSGMFLSLIVLSFVFIFEFEILKYFAIVFCGVYIVSFSMSLGPVALLLISEIFPLKFRGSAMSIAIISNFIFNFIVTALFPMALNYIGGFYTFLMFALICVISFLFVYFFVIETKGISLEEIEKQLKI